MPSLAALFAALLRFRARACVVLACLAATLCVAANASALEPARTKTRVWDFDFAEHNSTGYFELQLRERTRKISSRSRNTRRAPMPQGGVPKKISMDEAVERAANHKIGRFDVNPNNSTVRKLGSHLNLETKGGRHINERPCCALPRALE